MAPVFEDIKEMITNLKNSNIAEDKIRWTEVVNKDSSADQRNMDTIENGTSTEGNTITLAE